MKRTIKPSVTRTWKQRAFTLIELLVVIAITAILMTLIIVPVVQSFNLTRAAQGWAQAQDKARTLTERIAHEINNSRLVRDNTGVRGEIDVVVPARPGSGVTVNSYDPGQPWIRVPIYNAKLDLVMPFEGDPTLVANGAFINPYASGGPIADPTTRGPIGQVSLPASPGLTIVRYWVGLRDPLRTLQGDNTKLAGYIEPYTGLLQQRDNIRDNLFVLYRAEVHPYIYSARQAKFVVNKAFFYDYNRDNDAGSSGPYIDDPRFFDPAAVGVDDPHYNPDGTPNYSTADPDGTPEVTKSQMVQNWLDAAVIQTEVSRFDMIQPIYDLKSRQVQYDGNAPRLMTLIQFRPTRISSEPSEGQVAIRQNNETESADRLSPDVFVTKYPGWSNNVFIRTYPDTYNRGNTALDKYEVGRILPSPGNNDPQGLSVYLFDPEQGAFDDTQTGLRVGLATVGTEVFDMDLYKRGLRDGYRANLSRGIASANSRSGWYNNPTLHGMFEPYVADFDRGRTITSFGIDELGSVSSTYPFNPVALPDPLNNPNNLPSGLSWDPSKADPTDPSPTIPKTPFNDYPRTPTGSPNLSAGVFSDAQYSTINRKYNKIWFDYPALRGSIQRFLDLRLSPNDDGAPSPLSPDPATGFPRANIVPGSDAVYGPDQNPGPHYGSIVRYTRTTRDPGPNQYRINYTDLPEPVDYRLIGGNTATAPATYTPTDLVSAVLQPRYKAGYIQFDSDPNAALPGDSPLTPQFNEAKILVFYRFQFSRPNDVMAVDYDSRQLMTVQMTIRDYPQSTLPNPQTVTLHSSATVRNFLR